jgi:hypothetical protein
VPDTVTANGEGFVVLGSAIRETLYVSPAPTFAPTFAFQIACEKSDDVAELGELLSTVEQLKKR